LTLLAAHREHFALLCRLLQLRSRMELLRTTRQSSATSPGNITDDFDLISTHKAISTNCGDIIGKMCSKRDWVSAKHRLRTFSARPTTNVLLMWAGLQAIALRRLRAAVQTLKVFWEQSSPLLCHQFSKEPHHIYAFVFITQTAPFCTNKNYTAFCTKT
jgi:hypothetical protein